MQGVSSVLPETLGTDSETVRTGQLDNTSAPRGKKGTPNTMAPKIENAKLPAAKQCAKALTGCKTSAQVVAWTKSYMPTLGYKAVGRILVGESPEMAVAGKAERRALK